MCRETSGTMKDRQSEENTNKSKLQINKWKN